MTDDLNKLKRLQAATQKQKDKSPRVTKVNIKTNDNAINFEVLSDEELAWVMLGLGAASDQVSYIDKDKADLMKSLAAWKRKLVEKEPDREGHMDMLKVAMWDSY
jgi:hypothetical protein